MSYPIVSGPVLGELKVARQCNNATVRLVFGQDFPLLPVQDIHIAKLAPLEGYPDKWRFRGWRLGDKGNKVHLFLCYYDVQARKGRCFFLKNQHISCLKEP